MKSLKKAAEFGSCLDSEAWQEFCALCMKVADFPRHLSIHAGGVIVRPCTISEILPHRSMQGGRQDRLGGTRTLLTMPGLSSSTFSVSGYFPH
ncbi:hypothetical protein [Syntrophorhabdus aromaticivorans]|uniref:hypothetical protein n=1 Tax=Syntrophorhabdus aromaticivorans TaxID=328301 RepID=UPI0012EB72E1